MFQDDLRLWKKTSEEYNKTKMENIFKYQGYWTIIKDCH